MGVRVRAALRLICAISILTGAAWAQLARYDGFVAPAGYNFGPANIAVCQAGGSGGPPCTPQALIYADATGKFQISQPFQADINGRYYFYAAAGAYVVDTYGAGYTTTLTNISIGTVTPVTSGGNNNLTGTWNRFGSAVIDAQRGLLSGVPFSVSASGLVTQGLLAVYLFNEGQGTTLYDYSGNGNHATATSPSWQPTGMNFPTTSSFVTLPAGAWSTFKTIEWVGTTNNPGGNDFVICDTGGSGPCVASGLNLWRVYPEGSAYVDGQAVQTPGLRLMTYVSDPTLDHIYMDTTETAYESGKQGATGNVPRGTSATVGKFNTTGYTGTMSFLAIYSIELSQSQIAQNVAAVKVLLKGRNTIVPLVFSGDSLTLGSHSSAGNDYPSQLLRSLGNKASGYSLSNFGHAGDDTATLLTVAKTAADVDGQYSVLNPKNMVVFWAGTNDIYVDGNVTQSQIVSNINQFCIDRHTAGFDYCAALTTIARDSSDTGVGPANVNRLSFNVALKAGCSACDAIIDVAADSNFNTPADTGNTAIYFTDLLHLVDYGYGIVSQIVKSGLLPFFVYGGQNNIPICQLGGATGTASPAACGNYTSGVIAIPASQTTYTINTTAIDTNSIIDIQQITDNSGLPSSPTCSATAANPIQSARVVGTSFTFTLTSVAAVTCFKYQIVN